MNWEAGRCVGFCLTPLWAGCAGPGAQGKGRGKREQGRARLGRCVRGALTALAAPGVDFASWGSSGHHASRLAQIGVCGALPVLAAPGVDFTFWDASGHHAARLAQVVVCGALTALAAPSVDHASRLAQIAVCGALAALPASGVDLAFWEASGHHAPSTHARLHIRRSCDKGLEMGVSSIVHKMDIC